RSPLLRFLTLSSLDGAPRLLAKTLKSLSPPAGGGDRVPRPRLPQITSICDWRRSARGEQFWCSHWHDEFAFSEPAANHFGKISPSTSSALRSGGEKTRWRGEAHHPLSVAR